MNSQLLAIYSKLLGAFGPQHWWPAQSPFEVIVGAILTQNTAWTNVERAIEGLRKADLLTPAALAQMPLAGLQEVIRPAGFYRQKSLRLQRIAALLAEGHAGDVERFLAGSLIDVRRMLLNLHGIGPETADSILLYAGGHPSFVVDAYTMRIFTRLGFLRGQEGYESVRSFFMAHLPNETPLFNEYHALIVALAKCSCRKRAPRCAECPLGGICAASAAGVFGK